MVVNFPLHIKSVFENRKLVIATMHGKEQVLAPLLMEALGVEIVLPSSLNTDLLGTFTGEIERTLSPVDAAREKCRQAMEQTGCDLAIANEGSFGPHPFIGFVSSDEELVVLMDAKNNLEITAKELNTATNFDGHTCHSYNDVKAFAEKVQFPSHGLILRKDKNSLSPVIKGITEWDVLEKEAQLFLQTYGHMYAETDMRAMYNPSRLLVIEAAAKKLVAKIFSACPQCHAPGYDVTDFISGLPCSFCGTPTRSTLAHLYQCSHCHFEERKDFPYGKITEDPMYCDVCNP
jgi:hypothetical protein